MGLAIFTGYLADMLAKDAEGASSFKKDLEAVNKHLVKNKQPKHVEPVKRGKEKARRHVDSFPYSFLHYLRRAHARVRAGMTLTPVAPNEDPADDPTIDDEAAMLDSHLLCHSDCEGYYVPVDFHEVIFDTSKKPSIPGGMLGSSIRLMSELVEVAPAIGIKLDKSGKLSDAAAKRLAAVEEEHDYWRERLVWLALFEAARVSIANKCMIVFT